MKYYIDIKQFPKHWFSGKEGQWFLKEGKQYPTISPASCLPSVPGFCAEKPVEPSHLPELRTQARSQRRSRVIRFSNPHPSQQRALWIESSPGPLVLSASLLRVRGSSLQLWIEPPKGAVHRDHKNPGRVCVPT